VLEAERDAIPRYEQIIRACEGNDYVAQDIAIQLLADEEEHRVHFEGFLRSLTGGKKSKRWTVLPAAQ